MHAGPLSDLVALSRGRPVGGEEFNGFSHEVDCRVEKSPREGEGGPGTLPFGITFGTVF